MDHLDILELRLSNERVRLANAKTDKEREMRAAWVAQAAREVQREKEFCGMVSEVAEGLDDDDLLDELLG